MTINENLVNERTPNEQIAVANSLEGAKIAGSMAGRLGGVWTSNPECTTFIVAANTSEFACRKVNRYATIKVTA